MDSAKMDALVLSYLVERGAGKIAKKLRKHDGFGDVEPLPAGSLQAALKPPLGGKKPGKRKKGKRTSTTFWTHFGKHFGTHFGTHFGPYFVGGSGGGVPACGAPARFYRLLLFGMFLSRPSRPSGLSCLVSRVSRLSLSLSPHSLPLGCLFASSIS